MVFYCDTFLCNFNRLSDNQHTNSAIKNKYYMCYVKYLAIFACVKSEA